MPKGHGGHRNGAGRPRGSRNSGPLKGEALDTRKKLWEYCEEVGTDPFRVMASLLVDERMCFVAAKALAPYMLSQLQRSELDVGDELKRIIEHRYGNSRTDH